MNAILIYAFIPKSPEEKTHTNNNDHSKKSESSLMSMFKDVDWQRHWDLFATRFLLSFVVLLYRSSYNWMMSDKFHVDAVTQNYLASYQGVVSFLSSYYCNAICSRYNNDTLRIYKHTIILLLLALIGLVMSPTFVLFALFLTPLCISTSLMRVISLNLTTERCGESDHGLILGASGSVTSTARAISPALGGFLHDLDPDFPALFGVGCVLVSYVITVRYTDYNQIRFKLGKR